jgi:hypothetical protein
MAEQDKKPLSINGPEGLHFVWVGNREIEEKVVHLCGEDMRRIFCVPSEWVSDATEQQIRELEKLKPKEESEK